MNKFPDENYLPLLAVVSLNTNEIARKRNDIIRDGLRYNELGSDYFDIRSKDGITLKSVKRLQSLG